MASPRALLQSTHKVLNQAPLLSNYNLFTSNPCLSSSVNTYAKSYVDLVSLQGALLGTSSTFDLGDVANTVPPVLQTHDMHGNRIDVVKYTTAYHDLMSLGITAGCTSLPFEGPPSGGKSGGGAHTARAALMYMQNHVDPGHCCPLVMTFACVPVIKKAGPPSLKDLYLQKLKSRKYDGRDLPVEEKEGVTIGMSMTEKQGGSDVRSNSTTATPLAEPGTYSLVGHKWL
jgi:putative acyl-CoA dehydrogenase